MNTTRKYGYSIGDLVELKRDEVGYNGIGQFPAGTVLRISFITPKVRKITGPGSDNRDYFVGFHVTGRFDHISNGERMTAKTATVGTNFCNIKRSRATSPTFPPREQ